MNKLMLVELVGLRCRPIEDGQLKRSEQGTDSR